MPHSAQNLGPIPSEQKNFVLLLLLSHYLYYYYYPHPQGGASEDRMELKQVKIRPAKTEAAEKAKVEAMW